MKQIGRQPHDPNAPVISEQDQAPLPLRADPTRAALVGTVVLFALLTLPASLILVAAVFVLSIARNRGPLRRSVSRVGTLVGRALRRY